MLAIAGQNAGPNWLNIFEETHGYPWVNIKVYFIPRAMPGTTACFLYIYLYMMMIK